MKRYIIPLLALLAIATVAAVHAASSEEPDPYSCPVATTEASA